jgi:hypothetical protein
VLGAAAHLPLLPAPLAVGAVDEACPGTVTALTDPSQVGQRLEEVIGRLSRLLRGSEHYFRAGNAATERFADSTATLYGGCGACL